MRLKVESSDHVPRNELLPSPFPRMVKRNAKELREYAERVRDLARWMTVTSERESLAEYAAEIDEEADALEAKEHGEPGSDDD